MKISLSALGVLVLALVAAPAIAQDGGMAAIIEADARVEKLASGMKFTEGPVWLPKQSKVVWSDIPNSVQMEWTREGGLKKFRDVEATNGNLLDLEGRMLSCQHGGRNVIRTEADGTITVLADEFEGKKFNSPNDLAIRSDGAIFFTDPSYGLKGREAEIDGKWVYQLHPDGKVEVLYKGFDMPNGIAFAPDEKRVYVADTGQVGTVRAFAVPESGAFGEPLFELPVRCDGLCVDVKGNLYLTSKGGIHLYTGDGEKIGIIPTEEHPANVCFGGAEYRTLFITARTSLYSVRVKNAGAKPKTAKW